MRTYTSKIKSKVDSSFFDFFEMNGKKAKISLGFLVGFFIYSYLNPAPAEYLGSLQAQISLKSTDSIFDYTLPLFSSLMICYVFFEDYKGKIHEIIAFYNSSRVNRIMLYRWCFFVSLFTIGVIVCSLVYYRNIAFLNGTSILLSIRFIPNILFLSALMLVCIVLTKNGYIGLFMTISYYVVDFFSSSLMFKVFSIGAHSHNFYYIHSPEYYIVNRVLILLLSLVFVYISIRASSKA